MKSMFTAIVLCLLVLSILLFVSRREPRDRADRSVTKKEGKPVIFITDATITVLGDHDDQLIVTDSRGPFIFTTEPTLGSLVESELLMFTVMKENSWGGAAELAVRTITEEESRMSVKDMSLAPTYSEEIQAAMDLEAEFGMLFLNFSIVYYDDEMKDRHEKISGIVEEAARLSQENVGGTELLHTLQTELQQLVGEHLAA